MAFKGMNPDEGREVATQLNQSGQQVMDTIDRVTSIVNSVEWVGPDYDTFVADWNSFVSGQVTGLVDGFRAKGDELSNHADEQEQTSAT